MPVPMPLADKVVIRRRPPSEKTSGGIFIPDVAPEKIHFGDVLAVGPGTLGTEGNRLPMELKVGDVVVFARYQATVVVKIEGEEFVVLSEREILAVVPESLIVDRRVQDRVWVYRGIVVPKVWSFCDRPPGVGGMRFAAAAGGKTEVRKAHQIHSRQGPDVRAQGADTTGGRGPNLPWWRLLAVQKHGVSPGVRRKPACVPERSAEERQRQGF